MYNSEMTKIFESDAHGRQLFMKFDRRLLLYSVSWLGISSKLEMPNQETEYSSRSWASHQNWSPKSLGVGHLETSNQETEYSSKGRVEFVAIKLYKLFMIHFDVYLFS